MTTTNFRALSSTSGIPGLSTDAIAGLSTDDINSLTTTQGNAFLMTQIAAMSIEVADALAALTA
jgi:hypothetical protein